MNLLSVIFRVKRPSCIADMQAMVNTFICRKDFAGIMLFGWIFTNSRSVADSLNSSYSVMKNHEMIHLRQAQSTANNWFRYYALYLAFWLRGICLARKRRLLAYYLNPFEMEAYLNERNMHYLDRFENGVTGWKEYRKMTIAERYRVMKRSGKI
ncbi:MAG: hypothetical protein SOZ80_07130 [Prevotella sp.]|uniref:hypothetical protein n=1 Tax=Prevotella sp. TaxID=59823 RepID=UPI002A335DB8|nr:hypothetical protein [Prevotella sp.]MDD7317627.1 hypothetical protein [Prevotellaceae bacterium]MDY4020526.1 hypothetical protein [Prevotella sp.]